MDLGIAGRSAIVCASSSGLGFACAEALAKEGVDVVVNGRDPDRLAKAAAALDGHGVCVTPVVGDITTPEGRAALLAACPNPDILINNNAGPEPGAFLDLDEEAWVSALRGNMIAPVLMIRGVLAGMCARKFGRIVNITSAMVTTPRPHQALSSGARGGLTVVAKGQSFDAVRHNVTINNLLPERIDTPRQRQMAEFVMRRDGVSYEEARKRQVESIAARRLGRPEEFGAACAFLCSQYAGYISGQNLHLDGGSYPAVV